MANINKIADTPLHGDKTTFREMFEYLVSDGFFWTDGEPPNGEEAMQKTLEEALQKLIAASKEK